MIAFIEILYNKQRSTAQSEFIVHIEMMGEKYAIYIAVEFNNNIYQV